MVFQSLASDSPKKYSYELDVCHLYGNLLNTYGDNGNVLILKYVGEKLGAKMNFEIVSLEDNFDESKYDLVFFGGGQDYEQFIVSKDIVRNKEAITRYIDSGGVLLAVCGGFQLLGQYYIEANGRRIEGIGAMNHYTLNQENNRFIGDIEIYNDEFDETYYGFENHQGRTFLAPDEKPLGKIKYGQGNNNEDGTEGVHYKNVFGTYFHGPILSRNARLAYRLITIALENKYGKTLLLPKFEEILADEDSEAVSDKKRKVE
ncbi:MAG: type 1 glutamine amidotransferase [Streptococcaceae bacterium]|nr:type 1 glutamine amidotransferase [Streptococcaceae bacterium]